MRVAAAAVKPPAGSMPTAGSPSAIAALRVGGLASKRVGALAVCLAVAIAVLGAGAVPARGASGPLVATPTSVGSVPSPYVTPRSLTQLPVVITPGGVVRFHVDALAALRAAEQAPAMVSLHQREHPLGYAVRLWIGTGTTPYWAIDFSYGGAVVAEADVSRFGRVSAVWTGALAVYLVGRGHYGGLFDSPWVILSFSAAFLALFFNPRRARRPGHLDALLLLGLFAIPYYLFDHAHFDASVIAVYPLLVLVLARMLWLGLRRAPGADEGAPRWPLGVLAIGVLALVAARVALDIAHRGVLDVGVASVIGAHAISHGAPLYLSGPSHGDVYGPVTYLAYVPFEALWPWRGVWDYVPAAHAAAIFFDIATTVGLAALGMRLRGGEEGRRLGLTLAWAWAAYPATLLGLLTNTNDGLVALLFVLALLLMSSPLGRGLVLGLAAAAKLFPAILLPMFALAWRERQARRALLVLAAFALVVVASFAPFVPSGGLHQLYERTIGFQLHRSDLYSIWGLHPSLGWAKTIVQIAAVALALGVALTVRERSLAALAALACSVTVGVQLGAEHWFYNYLVWIGPFAFVALLAREPGDEVPRGVARAARARAGTTLAPGA